MGGTEATIVIAIDGPAASGKSTVARELARRLGFFFLSSGDFYRAMTWACLQRRADCGDAASVKASARQVAVSVGADGIGCFPMIDGQDPRPHLRDPQVTASVSQVSTVPEVRGILSDAIRAYVLGHSAVIEGRDIGSAVFPETPYKFYIDADPLVRQQRRSNQGQTEDVSRRDQIDSTRSTAPLTVAEGAVVIDSSRLDVEAVVMAALRRLAEQGLPGARNLCSNE